MGSLGDILFGSTGPRGGHREGMLEAMGKSAVRSVAQDAFSIHDRDVRLEKCAGY